jgi:selenocysteine lyase/cysteine desulfurase
VAGLAPKSDFIALEGMTSLVAGGEPPLLKRHRDAFEAYARDKARGFVGYWDHWSVNEEVRKLLADMLELQADDISLTGSASEGIAQVVSSIDWREGDNAVTAEMEYASGRFALSGLRKFGVDARIVDSSGWRIDAEQLVDACDERTRLVYLSQVNYQTGQQVDTDSLSAELTARGIPLLNDVSHALGVTPVDGRQADFLVCCGYKWLLATQTGIFVWNRNRWPTFEPRGIGWRSAASHELKGEFAPRKDANRAQVGNSNHLDVYLLRESLKYIQDVGIDRIRQHVLQLGDMLLATLRELGVEVITPETHDERAGNICFVHPDPRKIVDLAADEDILLWGDVGRIRVSIHLFNDEADIEKLIQFLSRNRAHLT